MKSFRFVFLLIVLALTVFSCSSEGGLQEILGLNSETKSPVFLDCRPVSSTEVVFTFSHPVSVVSIGFEPTLEIESIEDGSEVKVTFVEDIEAGTKITADILVEDSMKDTLNVIVPFRARNDRMPALVFNELRTEYTKPKAEFVEFLAVEAGNLGAMRLFIAGNSLSEPVYEFPPAEVAAGEYIVLHLRTLDEGCVDETGSNMALSGGTEAHGQARDFWLPNTAEMLRKTDALWLMDQDDRIIDAVVFSESAGSSWSNSKVAEAARFLAGKKAWLPLSKDDDDEYWVPKPDDVFISKGTSTTKTICRDESLPAEPRVGNWYITATNGLTPGEKNKSSDGGVQQNSNPGTTPPAAPVESLTFLGYQAVSRTEIIFRFSLPVRIISFTFDPYLETVSKKAEGREVKITFTEALDEGKTFNANIHVDNSNGTSFNQTVPFKSRNDHMPAIVFNEIRTEYSKPKAEFVEFFTLGSGNLGALRLFAAGYSLTKPVYEFPPAKVNTGEYIVLHLRTLDTDVGTVDETGDDLTLSGGTEADDKARDLWISGTAELLRKSDALWLMDQDDRIIDAVVFNESDTAWKKNYVAEAANFLSAKNAWLPSADLADAAKSTGTTYSRTICRDETIPPIPMAGNWYLTASSNTTPGTQNSTKR